MFSKQLHSQSKDNHAIYIYKFLQGKTVKPDFLLLYRFFQHNTLTLPGSIFTVFDLDDQIIKRKEPDAQVVLIMFISLYPHTIGPVCP